MEQNCPECEEGAPAWVMTFADLMSLLMCFFVLLLAFSEMDVLKFKQVAGSMDQAFGVQKLIKSDGIPKGTSIIASEFSPGKPVPTVMQVVQQMTTNDSKRNLEFTDTKFSEDGGKPPPDLVLKNHEKAGNDIKEEIDDTIKDLDELKKQNLPGKDIFKKLNNAAAEVKDISKEEAASEELAERMKKAAGKLRELAVEALNGKRIEKRLAQTKVELERIGEQAVLEELDRKIAKAAAELQKQAEELKKNLKHEIKQGMLEIEVFQDQVVVRIREKGSFASGSAQLQSSFIPILNKIGSTLKRTEGNIIVSGHTDNVPISTSQYPSNWVLSAARASTVVHYLFKSAKIDPKKVQIRAHADIIPVASNKDREGRAKNRRVEIIIAKLEIKQLLELTAGDGGALAGNAVTKQNTTTESAATTSEKLNEKVTAQ